MNFEVLKKMGDFTEEMFNLIIGFQEKDHPAWNSEKPFSERIKRLPLHALIFSNPDRNPETHGPTVAHYFPLRWEMQTLARYAKIVSNKPIVFDVYPRNGFIGSLLAREGIKVIGWRDPAEKPNQIANFYDAQNYEMHEQALSSDAGAVDMIFANWTPAGRDDTALFAMFKPKLIVYVYTDHINEHSKQRQTGVDGAFGEHLPEQYQLVDQWQVLRRTDLLHEVWPDLTGNIEEVRQVKVFALREFDKNHFERLEVCKGAPYDWEKDLTMAETAHEAKLYLVQHGFPAGVV